MNTYKSMFKGCYEYEQVKYKADTTEEIENYYMQGEGKTYEEVFAEIERLDVVEFDEDTSIVTLFADKGNIESFKFNFSNYNKNKVTELFLSKIDEANENFSVNDLKENDIILIEYETNNISKTDFHKLINRMNAPMGGTNRIFGKRVKVFSFASKYSSTVDGELKTEIDFSKNYTSFQTEKFDVLMGVCEIKPFVDSYLVSRDAIFTRNVRVGLNDKRLSSSIICSIIENPIDFSLHHNGIVIYAKSREVNTSFSNITLKDYSVVNGAQTLSTIGTFYEVLESENEKKILKMYNFEEKGFHFTFAFHVNSCEKIMEKDVAIKLVSSDGKVNRDLIKNKIKEKLSSNLILADDKHNDYYFTYAERRLIKLYKKIDDEYKIDYENIIEYVDERINKADIVTKIFSNKKGYNKIFDDMAENDVSKVSFSSNNQVAIGAKDKYINHDVVSALNNEYIQIKKSGEKQANYEDKYLFSLSDALSIIKAVADNKPGKSRAQKKDDLIEEYVRDNFEIPNFITFDDDYEIKANTTRALLLYKIFDRVRLIIEKSDDYSTPESAESIILKYGKYHLFNYVYNNIEDWEEIDLVTKKLESVTFVRKSRGPGDEKYCNDNFGTVKQFMENGIQSIKSFIESEDNSLSFDTNSFKKDFYYNVDYRGWVVQ